MKMYVPCIGTTFTLLKDWEITLTHEKRNMEFIYALGLNKYPPEKSCYAEFVEDKRYIEHHKSTTTIPAGVTLKVDRLYIKQAGNIEGGLNYKGEFNSVTLRVVKDFPNTKVGKKRFWVKLYDFNQIECDLDESTMQPKV